MDAGVVGAVVDQRPAERGRVEALRDLDIGDGDLDVVDRVVRVDRGVVRAHRSIVGDRAVRFLKETDFGYAAGGGVGASGSRLPLAPPPPPFSVVPSACLASRSVGPACPMTWFMISLMPWAPLSTVRLSTPLNAPAAASTIWGSLSAICWPITASDSAVRAK